MGISLGKVTTVPDQRGRRRICSLSLCKRSKIMGLFIKRRQRYGKYLITWFNLFCVKARSSIMGFLESILVSKAASRYLVMRFRTICIEARSSILRFLKSISFKDRSFDSPSLKPRESYSDDSLAGFTQESSGKDGKLRHDEQVMTEVATKDMAEMTIHSDNDDLPPLDQNAASILSLANLGAAENRGKITEERNEEKRKEDEEEKKNKTKIKRKRRRKTTVKKTVVVDDEERWIKHYSSSHRILLVGEGDFSFAACLAVAFGNASKMIATSLNNTKFLKNYQHAMSNVEELTTRGCKVIHGIDATEMANHTCLKTLKFDRIVFNFPFAGFYKKHPPDSVLHFHRSLVSKFLMNAKKMIRENGEIHVSHKTNGVHKKWDLENIASSHGLRLIEAVEFKLSDYPGYKTRSGFGGDSEFNCYPSKTFKFGLNNV